MFSNLVSLINKSLNTHPNTNVSAIKPKSNNPFSLIAQDNLNPFLSTTFGTSSHYGKNQPVQGGYFAGYYNGKPNIVGRRLFIEV